MKYFWTAMMVLAMVGIVSGQALEQRYQRPCGDIDPVDLCTWDNVMPLGSADCCGCNLDYNTYWPLGSAAAPSDATVTCTFDGSLYNVHDLYFSIDNDIIECKLNGNLVTFDNGLTYYNHEGCASDDPRIKKVSSDTNHATLGATAGMNTLVCKVRDRGSMSHFDACVVGQERTQEMPEFPSSAVPLIILTIVPAMAFVMVGRKK